MKARAVQSDKNLQRDTMERIAVTDQEFEQCMRCMKGNDKNALKQVYEAYLPYIYRIVLGIVENKEQAEDVTSEFFIKLWDISDTYKPGRGHRGWLATIARNLAIDSIRKTKREVLTDSFEEKNGEEEGKMSYTDIQASDQNPAEKGNSQSLVEDEVVENLSIQEALAKLNEKEREVVHLKVMGELSFKEIAQILEEPMGTITWRYQNAIKKLRRCGYE